MAEMQNSRHYTYEVLDVSIDIFLHATGPCGNPAPEWTELDGVRLMAGAVTFLRQLYAACTSNGK